MSREPLARLIADLKRIETPEAVERYVERRRDDLNAEENAARDALCRLVGRIDAHALALEWIEGQELARSPERFERAKELLERIREIVAEMHADGTLSALSMEWFGEDFTQAQ